MYYITSFFALQANHHHLSVSQTLPPLFYIFCEQPRKCLNNKRKKGISMQSILTVIKKIILVFAPINNLKCLELSKHEKILPFMMTDVGSEKDN